MLKQLHKPVHNFASSLGSIIMVCIFIYKIIYIYIYYLIQVTYISSFKFAFIYDMLKNNIFTAKYNKN